MITDTGFSEDVHGKLGCIGCHKGNKEAQDKEAAHVGLVADPSDDTCNICHDELAHDNSSSLHDTASGMMAALAARGGTLTEGSTLETAFDNHCNSCHTTCGQCHVSRPTTLGGGLLAGHTFKKVPPMADTCGGCHGARVAAEYFGDNAGIPGDVHWTRGGMTCFDCHDEDEMHGDGQPASDRYHYALAPDCRDCHTDVSDSNPQHQMHFNTLACQVCHSVEYKNCYNCHVNLDDNGTPYFTSDPSQMDFRIGLNPIKSEDRPYDYTVLRHVPVNAGTFDYYGEDLLPDFDALPTWKFATPHNIQLDTPQNESCDSCHGNEDIFLEENDVDPAEIEANRDVIVPEAPGPG
jgi:hypothetical protein